MIYRRDTVSRRALIMATLIVSVALAGFAWIAATVESDGTFMSIDTRVASWLHLHAMPGLTKVMIALSFAGAPSTLTVVAAVVCVVLARERGYDQLLALIILVLGGNLLNYALKFLLHRGRPVFEDPLLTLASYSFPSGHAMASTVFYGYVIAYVFPAQPRRHRAVTAAGVMIIGLVCFSRVYLGVHYVSDVLAGILEGVAWSTLILTALQVTGAHLSDVMATRRTK